MHIYNLLISIYVSDFQIVIESLRAGKHVIAEKPLSLSYQLCQAIIDEKKHHPELLTTVNLPFRFTSGAIKLKEEIQQEKIGELKKIEFTMKYPKWPRTWQNVTWLKSRKEGGALREVGTHFYFLLNEIFGIFMLNNGCLLYFRWRSLKYVMAL